MYFKTFKRLTDYVESNPIIENEELMVLVADHSSEELEALREFLNGKSIKFFGGIYPGLLVGHKKVSEGFIIFKLKPIYTTLVLPHLMRFKLDLSAFENATALILVDGLSSKMKDLTDTVFDKLGNKVKYIGGGAGFYDLKHRPCIFDNKGVYQDVLIVSIIPCDVKIAVKHGWNRLAGPFYISKSRDNILSELDSENAFEVYKDIIEEFENITLSAQDFFSFAKDHPFGICQKGHADIVRDPILLNENGEIICVANIPEHKEAYILKGDVDTLLAASVEAAEECADNSYDNYMPLLFDCISRAMFMQERFDEELSNIQMRIDNPVLGTLCVGEIASLSDGSLEIHNKSTVLGVVEL